MIRVTPTASTITDDQLDQLYAEIDRLADAEARVRELHEPNGGDCGTCADETGQAARWPCATIRALDGPAAPAEQPQDGPLCVCGHTAHAGRCPGASISRITGCPCRGYRTASR